MCVKMKENYIIETFDPLKATDQELFEVFNLLDILFREKEKDDPLPTKEFRLKNFRHKNPEIDSYWWLLKYDERVIGFSILNVRNKDSPSYEKNKHIAYFQMRIQKEYRRNGLGLELLKKIMTKAKEFEAITTLQNNTSYESGFAFCTKLNGILCLESSENRCYIKDVDWALMLEWKEQGQIRAKQDGRSLLWFEKCPEDIIEEFCKVYTETMNEQPFGELESRPLITPETLRKSEEDFEKLNSTWHAVISREKNGAISGVTDIIFAANRAHRIEQELTGVKKEYRGKGLGKWLKAEMLFFIRKKYPNVKFISTGNADANAAMLSINTRMGFKLHQQIRSYKFRLTDLEKRITEIKNH